MQTEERRLNKFLWLWFPIFVLAIHLIAPYIFSPATLLALMQENGPDELFQFFTLVAAFVVTVSILPGFPARRHPWLTAYFVFAAICCFFVGGEEVSWGQWFFHWHTPATQFFAANTQHETNIHNTYRWANQQPRAFLEAGVIVGGLIIPLIARFKRSLLPVRFNIIYPPAILAVTALCFLFFKLTNTIGRQVFHHYNMYVKVEEIEETYMYWFTLLYVIILRWRLLPLKDVREPVLA